MFLEISRRRDHAFDAVMESEARITMIVIAIAVAMLLLGTCIRIAFYGSGMLTAIPKMFNTSSLSNQANSQAKTPITSHKTELPDTDTPSTNSEMHSQRATDPPQQHRGIFLPIRKYASAPHRNAGVYAGAKRFQSTHTIITAPHAAYQAHNPPLTSSASVSPHISAWARVADSVVGCHPNAQPLSARVATQAEIDLISGHVHIPWAFKADPSRPRPTAVKVVPPVVTPQHAPFGAMSHNHMDNNVLREVTNTNRGRDVWNSNAAPSSEPVIKRLPVNNKGKAPARRPLGRPPTSIVAADLVEPGSELQ